VSRILDGACLLPATSLSVSLVRRTPTFVKLLSWSSSADTTVSIFSNTQNVLGHLLRTSLTISPKNRKRCASLNSRERKERSRRKFTERTWGAVLVFSRKGRAQDRVLVL